MSVNIPANVIRKMQSMSPEQRAQVIDYYRRNDEEEIRLGAKTAPVTRVKKKSPPKKAQKPPALLRKDPDIPVRRKRGLVDRLYEQAFDNPASATSQVLKTEAKKRDLADEEVARLVNWQNQVAQVESGGIPDRMQNDNPEGIGEGLFQFENSKGSGTNLTARNRLRNWEEKYGELNIPKKDREELQKEDPSFAKLTEDTQRAIFFVHHSLHPETPLTDIAKGEADPAESWAKYHWAGPQKEIRSKIKQWNRATSPLRQRAAQAGTFVNSMFRS